MPYWARRRPALAAEGEEFRTNLAVKGEFCAIRLTTDHHLKTRPLIPIHPAASRRLVIYKVENPTATECEHLHRARAAVIQSEAMATFTKPDASEVRSDREAVFDAFRRWGYLRADLDPLKSMELPAVADLDLDGPVADEARRYYCGTIGAEFMHIPDPERRRWIEERLESGPPAANRERILQRLVEAELFEQMLQARYLGTKRFSLEGNSALIPLQIGRASCRERV